MLKTAWIIQNHMTPRREKQIPIRGYFLARGGDLRHHAEAAAAFPQRRGRGLISDQSP